MALTCPNCEKINGCNCKNCDSKTHSTNVIIDYENECYQCWSCGHKFTEGDSLDFDWNKLLESFKRNITPKMCIEWHSLLGRDRQEYERSFGQYGFEFAFFHYFGIRHNNCSPDDLKIIKLRIDRENKINKIID